MEFISIHLEGGRGGGGVKSRELTIGCFVGSQADGL